MTRLAELLPRQGIAPAKPHAWIPLRHLYSSCTLESLPPGCLAAIVAIRFISATLRAYSCRTFRS
jgi:hypothetical protein